MAFNLPIEVDDPERPWPPYATERLWVEVLGRDRYRVDNIPFFVKPLALDDIVLGRLDVRTGEIWFSERVEWHGHSMVRIFVFANEDEILETLEAFGCTYER